MTNSKTAESLTLYWLVRAESAVSITSCYTLCCKYVASIKTMRSMQACGIIKIQDSCTWDLGFRRLSSFFTGEPGIPRELVGEHFTISPDGILWSAIIKYIVIQQKMYKSLKPPKSLLPATHWWVTALAQLWNTKHLTDVVTIFLWWRDGGNAFLLVVIQNDPCRPEAVKTVLRVVSNLTRRSQGSKVAVKKHEPKKVSVSCENCLLWSWSQKEPIWQPIWLSKTSLVKGPDVSHMIPLSFNSQEFGIASKVVELVHIDSSSPVANLATFPLATATIKKQNGLNGLNTSLYLCQAAIS